MIRLCFGGFFGTELLTLIEIVITLLEISNLMLDLYKYHYNIASHFSFNIQRMGILLAMVLRLQRSGCQGPVG